MASLRDYLRRSEFIVGLVRWLRGLKNDVFKIIWLSRRRGRVSRYLRSHAVRKLQIGASGNVLPDWFNTDISLVHGDVAYLDATRRFPFDDNTFDYVMSEHMIEHIEYPAAQVMLRECYRVLKPGGRARFATPDLHVVLALHSEEKSDSQKKYLQWAVATLMPDVKTCESVFVINNFFRAWGHTFLYDKQTLQHLLHSSGFRDIKFYKPGNSDDPNLRNIEGHGREITEEINQFETIVIEGSK